MRNVLGALVAILIACAPRSAPIIARPERPRPPLVRAPSTEVAAIDVGGWVNYWEFTAGMHDVHSVAGSLSDVFFFTAHLDGSASPIPARAELDPSAAVRAVRDAGARPWLTIVNDVVDGSGRVLLKDAPAIQGVLGDPARRAAHRAAIVALAKRYGAAGVDVDYERVFAKDRDRFTAFVVELRGDLSRAGLALSVTVQPKVAESRSDGAGSADWAALCASVDRLQIMLYNEHSGKTGPGPVATPAWMERVLRFALTQCPADKIVAAIKVVGIEWSPDGTRDVPFAKALLTSQSEHAAVSRSDGEVPWLSYGDGARKRTVYFEDARSLLVKVQTVRKLGIGRVVLWTLGAEDPEFWDAAAGLIRGHGVPVPAAVRPDDPPLRTAARSAARG